MAVMMVFTMMPSMAFAEGAEEGVSTQATSGKIFVTCNVENAVFTSDGSYNVTGIMDKPVIWVTGVALEGDDKGTVSNHLRISILNLPQIIEKYTVEYIDVDGKQITMSDFEKAKSNTALDTGSCGAMKDKTVNYQYNGGKLLVMSVKKQIESLTADVNIRIQLKENSDNKKLTVTAGDNGEFIEANVDGETSDGKTKYKVTAKPNTGYQLASYTIKDGATVPLTLTANNYLSGLKGNSFEISIDKDTEITLNFTQATMDLELSSYQMESTIKSYWYIDQFNRTFSDGQCVLQKQFDAAKDTVPLLEKSGAKFWIKVNINGYMPLGTDVDLKYILKIYNGTEVKEENLIFDSEDDDTVNEAGNNRYFDNDNTWFHGGRPGGAYVGIPSCPDLENIAVVANYGGYQLTKTFSVQMAGNIAEVKTFTSYYTDTYGLDKFGLEAYTAEEKLSDGYEKYCKYSNFRYVLRKVYNEYLPKIATESNESKRQTLLVEAKKALDDAAIGKNCNAVVWSFPNDNGLSNVPVMVAVPNDVEDYTQHPSPGTSAHDSMQAALEALHPGNWTYRYTATGLGVFVNNLTAGGADDIGTVKLRIASDTGTSYGFWYYNGKFSDWGVSNYNPYDGDVMWWGGGDVEKNWAWAKVRLYYQQNDDGSKSADDLIAEALKAKGVTKSISAMTADEIKTAFIDLSDGNGKDFFRRNGQFRDLEDWEPVVSAIGAIGSVSPDSGDKIKAARDAYDALSDADKAKVSNYQTLVDAEEAYKALTEGTSTSFESALAGVLSYFKNEDSISGVGKLGVASTKGEYYASLQEVA